MSDWMSSSMQWFMMSWSYMWCWMSDWMCCWMSLSMCNWVGCSVYWLMTVCKVCIYAICILAVMSWIRVMGFSGVVISMIIMATKMTIMSMSV